MKKLIIIFISLFLLKSISAQKYTEKYINDANEVAKEWWNQINSGKYEQSYSILSDILKDRATITDWVTQMSLLMDEFGDIKSRTVTKTYFKNNLEGFKDGFYVIIEYDVNYSKTRKHKENIILKQSDQFKWLIFDFNYSFHHIEMTE